MIFPRTLSTRRRSAVGGTKMAKPLIFLAAVGATFNRRLVDTARVVSPRSSANIAFSSVRCVRECRPAWNFSRSPPSGLPPIPIRSRRFALESKTGQAAPDYGRRFKQSKGKRARRKKKANQDGPASLSRFAPWVRDTSRYRRVVVDRSFDHSGWRKIQLVSERLCEGGGRRQLEQTRGWNHEPARLSMYFQYRDKAI